MHFLIHAVKFIGERFEENGFLVGLCTLAGAIAAIYIGGAILGTDPSCQGTTATGMNPCLYDGDKLESGLATLGLCTIVGAFVGALVGSWAVDASRHK